MQTGQSKIELIVAQSHLVQAIDHLSKAPRVAVDIESNGFFRYHERICLVQLATAGSAILLDPLAIEDIRPLGKLLGDRSVEKVFHSADYDLRSLDRDWGFRVSNLFDTSIAAAFTGSTELGLQPVVHHHVGVELKKHRKLQLSDWTKRPLSAEALSYAANDVLYLGGVRDSLAGRLKSLSRLEWVKEEFERLEKVRHVPRDRDSAFLSSKGSRSLDGRGLALLRSLFQFREREARRLDRPPFKVTPDSALLLLASDPSVNLSTVKGLGRFGRPPDDKRLKATINEGLASPPVTRPKRTGAGERMDPAERRRVETRLRSLKDWRGRLGRSLQLDPSLLWPAVSLGRLARRPGSLDSELASPEVRNWQWREFERGLKSVLATLV